ncbi:DUF3060 domain-containing protein [Streptomyces sp. NBC_00005]|uniref:DUF3060 domain-containing protein n=1 Tax=Streptomyces sp. NBC_00005 TaxID=2903609 RepID=UPI00324A288D
MRISRLLPTTLIALALSTTVGCAVDVAGPAKSGQAQSPTPQTPGSGSGASSPAAVGSPSSGNQPTASSSAGAANSLKISGNYGTQTADCSGRDVVIEGNSNSIVFKGNCGKITLAGGYNTIAVEAVDTLQVTGQTNEAYVKTVGTIQMAGATYSTVHWVGGAGADNDPTVSSTGDTNTVEKISQQDYEDEIAP